MKMNHLFAVAALSLLAGHQAKAYEYDWNGDFNTWDIYENPVTIALVDTYDTGSNHTETPDGYKETQKIVKEKIGNKEILEMALEGDIKGWSIVVETNRGDELYDSYYGIKAVKDGEFDVDLSGYVDLYIEATDDDGEDESISSFTYIDKGSKANDKYTSITTAYLDVNLWEDLHAELSGVFTSQNVYNESNGGSERYMTKGEMSDSSAPAYDWWWWNFESTYYFTEDFISGTVKLGVGKFAYNDD
jgi:hypothetical protein